MASWLYLWENGDVTLVSAATKEDAIFMLDEEAEASMRRLKPVPEGFFVSFSPTKTPSSDENEGWTHEGHSESVWRVLHDVEKEARRRAFKYQPKEKA